MLHAHTCCRRSRAAMSRVVSLLLGAALLCGHGAFSRRVVSGESGGRPPVEGTDQLERDRGARARGRCEAPRPGVEALPGTGNQCGEKAGKRIVFCFLLRPTKHT